MARTILKNSRVYIDGYELCAYTQTFGPLSWVFNATEFNPICSDIKSYMPDQCEITPTSLSGIFDNTETTGLHAALSTAGVERTCMFNIGFGGAPEIGDPSFVGQFPQAGYIVDPQENTIALTIPFGGWSGEADTIAYNKPWGTLLHEHSAETGANTSGTAGEDGGGQTTKGGYMCYQVSTSDGTVAIKVQDSTEEVNGSYGDLLTSGDINASAAPVSGIVALAATATVEQYTRWQIALNTANTVTFALTFVRGV